MTNRVVAKLIGGAGTGKTAELMRLIEQVAEAGVQSHEIGYVSFTRAARAEAATRAARVLGTTEKQLTRNGWFKTIHSICMNCLEAPSKGLITDDKASLEWMESKLEGKFTARASDDDANMPFHAFDGDGLLDFSLNLWSIARSRLLSLEEAHTKLAKGQPGCYALPLVAEKVRLYERGKWMDNRFDFTDVLARFSGWRFTADGDPQQVAPEGTCPDLRVWFHDEFQDASALLFSAFERMMDAPSVQWVYLAGDPFQNLYTFNGADHHILVDFPADKEKIMPQSWRCPKTVLATGERALQTCSDYFDRKIAPKAEMGRVGLAHQFSDIQIDPRESWLILARTNFHANRLCGALRRYSIPWCPVKGNGGWARPAKNHAWWALSELAERRPIGAPDWARAIEILPAKVGEQELLTRGTKARFGDAKAVAAMGEATLDTLSGWGASAGLIERLTRGDWPEVTDDPASTREWLGAVHRYGLDVVIEPRVRVGTVHSAKGMEASNVVLLSTTTQKVQQAERASRAAADEEARIAYVGITRAKERLVVLREAKAQKAGLEMPALLSALGVS